MICKVVKYICKVSGLCHFVFSSLAAKRHHPKDKKTPREKKKRRKNAMQKDKITPWKRQNPPREKIKFQRKKDKKKKKTYEKTPFETLILSSFRLASFCLFAWHYFVLSSGVFSLRKDEKTKKKKKKTGKKTKRRHEMRKKNDKTPGEKAKRTTNSVFLMVSFRMAFSSFALIFRLFTWRLFVLSPGVFSSFFLASFHLFNFLHGVF